ncbi:MAG: FkbM family methyltransferase [Burkholderiaceae bacterium]
MKDSLLHTLSSLADRHPRLLGSARRSALALRRRSSAREINAIEGALDRISALVQGDICVRVNEFDGVFHVDARSALFRRLVHSGHYEPELSSLCRELVDRDRDVLDIGANVGFHAVLFGKLLRSGRVLSVEPTNNALARLKHNIELNQVGEKVIVHHGAVSDAAGEITIKTIPGREEFSSIGNIEHPSARGEKFNLETVSAATVDQLVDQHQLNPGFVKVDVEGVEHLVFSGADQLLSKHRPIILAELTDPLLKSNGSSAAQVVQMFERYDYQVTDPLRPSVVPGTREFGDILCRPR